MNKRKMAFYEINKGQLAEEMQRAFENCQKVTHENGLPTELSLRIKILPSTDKDERFGGIQYSVSQKYSPKTSKKFTTELSNNGLIIAEGNSPIDVLQEELEFNETKILTINGEKDG